MKHKDEHLDIAFCKRRHQVSDDIKQEVATDRLEQKQVKHAVQDILDSHHSCLLCLRFATFSSHHLVIFFEGAPYSLQGLREEGWTTQAMKSGHKHAVN